MFLLNFYFLTQYKKKQYRLNKMYKNNKLFLLLKTIFPLYMTMFTVCMLIICIRLLYKKDVLVIIFETDLNDTHLVKYEETLKK